MEEMKKLADTGNLDELRSRMTLYLEKEEFYRNEGMSFTVNEELTAIAEMLRQIHWTHEIILKSGMTCVLYSVCTLFQNMIYNDIA